MTSFPMASEKPNSAFLQTLTERGFLNQCSDPATLDAAMRQVFIHLPLIRRAEEWRDGAGLGVRR